MSYKLECNGSKLTNSAELEVIRTYRKFTKDIEKLKAKRDKVHTLDGYHRAREEWLEVTNEFIGFQKCLKSLSIKIKENEK